MPEANPLRWWATSLVEVRRTDAGPWVVSILPVPGSSGLHVCTTTRADLAEEFRLQAVRLVEAVAREALLRDWNREETTR